MHEATTTSSAVGCSRWVVVDTRACSPRTSIPSTPSRLIAVTRVLLIVTDFLLLLTLSTLVLNCYRWKRLSHLGKFTPLCFFFVR